ncbi:phosphomannomutase/phosphoglucomutase [Corynebacterium pyruviciproducens]
MTTRSPEFIDTVIKAYDVRGVVGETLDADLVRDIGAAFSVLIKRDGETSIAVAHDMRESSPELAQAFSDGARAQGVDVIFVGLSSTDELYYTAGALNTSGAMFTASHNPAKYNGIKLCRPGAKPVSRDTGLAEIALMVCSDLPEYDGEKGSYEERDMLQGYVDHLRGLVDLSGMRPMTVAVDAGNGMAGHTVPAAFERLPITLKPLYFELDGTFPNHEANPLDPKNLVDLQKFTPAQKADIGLAFDGDADRLFVVDEHGEPVSPSAICALVATRYLKKFPGATIIHNLITSKTVPELITENGGHPVRSRVGHSFIKALMAKENAAFGGEHSAHYYFQEFFNADSGLLTALHVLAALGESDQPLSELMADYSRYEASGEINTRLAGRQELEDKTQAVCDAFADRTASIDRLDGVTVQLAGTPAWFNLRASNTEPLLRLNVEAPAKTEVDEIVEEVLAIVRNDE